MKLARHAAPAIAAVILALSPAFSVVGAVAAPSTTTPSDQGSLDEKIKSAREQVLEASAEEARLLGQIDASAARKKQLDAAVGSLEAQVRSVQNEVATAESRLAAVEVEEARVSAQLAQTQARMEVAKAELVRLAIDAYTGQTGAVRFIDVTLKARGIGELVAKRQYIKVVTTNQTEVIAAHEHLRDEVEDLRKDLGQARIQAQTQRDVVASKRSSLQAQRDAQAATVSKVGSEIAEGSRLRGEALARKKEFQAEVDALQRESDMIAATLRARASTPAASSGAPTAPSAGGSSSPSSGSAAPASSGGRLASPIPGAAVVSGFGQRVHPIYGDVRMHSGVDYAASEGTPIRAAGNGVVVSAGSYGGYGNATVIDHGGGLATLYAHQSSMGVSGGQQVTRGQVIGRVGCTGACTGPHLHFEVRVKGSPVNPIPYLS